MTYTEDSSWHADGKGEAAKYEQDEFQLQAKRDETIRIMKQRVSAFPLDEDVTIYANLQLGKYDFAEEAFPIVNMNESAYFHVHRWSTGTFPSQFKVSFSNYQLISALRMSLRNSSSLS